MLTPSTAYVNALTTTGVGVTHFSIDDLRRVAPINKIMTDTRSPVTYSYLAWPKGWSLSGGVLDSLNPTSVTTLLPASDKLLIASAMMVMLPPIMPAMSFIVQRMPFVMMPKMPAQIP